MTLLGGDEPPGALVWLQAWYASQCDGDWEHDEGVTISTLDNPGWDVRIHLSGTELEGRTSDRVTIERGGHDWVTTWVEDDVFNAACGPLNLGEALHTFRQWADPDRA